MILKKVSLIIFLSILFTSQIIHSENSLEQRKLNNLFLDYYTHPKYCSDEDYRYPMPNFQSDKLRRYKPNFGKKIFFKSPKLKTVRKYEKLFGELNRKVNIDGKISTLSKGLVPFLKNRLKDYKKDFDYKEWLNKFEEWGRTLISLNKGRMSKINLTVWDFPNGNYIETEKRVFYIEENKQILIDAIFEYYDQKDQQKKNKVKDEAEE